MDDDTRKRLEYEEQFYGMSSRFFIDSFKNFVKDEITSKINLMVDNFKNKIIHQANNVEKFENGLKGMKEALLSEYSKSLNCAFQENQKDISNILNIPQNVLLKEDLNVRNGVNGDIDKIKNEINDLKKNYQSLIYLKHILLDELEEANSLIFLMENFISNDTKKFDILPVEEISELSKQNKLIFKKFNNI